MTPDYVVLVLPTPWRWLSLACSAILIALFVWNFLRIRRAGRA